MEGKQKTIRDVIIDSCIIVMSLYSVYIYLNEATNGEFGRELSIKLTKTLYRIRENVKHAREFDASRGKVIWDAINIVEGTDDT